MGRFKVLSACIFSALVAVVFGRATANAATCPGVYTVESSNGHDYVVVFSAMQPEHATFAVTLYGQHRAYAFTLDNVAVDKPMDEPTGRYRSAPTLIANPDSAPLLADSVDITKPGAACATERHQIKAVDEVVHPRYERSAASLATLHAIVAETSNLTTVVNPAPRPDIAVPECAKQFEDAKMQHVVPPAYPSDTSGHRSTGTALVKVTLSESGSVADATIYSSSGSRALDESAMQAARATTYAPETFLCQPRAGSYIYTAQFR